MQGGAGRTQGAQILHLKLEARVTSFIQQMWQKSVLRGHQGTGPRSRCSHLDSGRPHIDPSLPEETVSDVKMRN